MKHCPYCGLLKPLSEFRNRTSQRGVQSYCRPCEVAHVASRRGPWSGTRDRLRRRGLKVSISTLKAELGEPTSCYLCGEPNNWDTAEIDHVEPLVNGGPTTLSNLRWTHRTCNRMKHDLTLPEFTAQIQKILCHLHFNNQDG